MGVGDLQNRDRKGAALVKLSADEFVDLVEEALADIPPVFVPYLRDVSVDVEPMPTPRDLEAVGLKDPRRLLGLYHGTPLTGRSVEHNVRMPDRIVIYQLNIERVCRTRSQLVRQIRKTVLHEVGHHFGMDEDDLGDVGYR